MEKKKDHTGDGERLPPRTRIKLGRRDPYVSIVSPRKPPLHLRNFRFLHTVADCPRLVPQKSEGERSLVLSGKFRRGRENADEEDGSREGEIEGTAGGAKTYTYRANHPNVLINRVRALRMDRSGFCTWTIGAIVTHCNFARVID